ncbi:MAG: T9SS type A sorting domain-containing protein, partial [Bacteroidota bacterium]
TGTTTDQDSLDRETYFIRVDQEGNALWESVIGYPESDDFSNDIAASGDDWIFAGVRFTGGNYNRVFAGSLDAEGETNWLHTATVDSTFGRKVLVLPNGNILITGSMVMPIDPGDGNIIYQQDLLLYALDAEGNYLWHQTYGGELSEDGYDLLLSPDGEHVYILGVTQSYGAGGFDGWVLKVDTTGQLVWDQTIGGTYQDLAFDLEFSEDQTALYTVGYEKTNSADAENIWLTKLDTEGNVFWEETIALPGIERPQNITLTPDDYLILSGVRQIDPLADRELLLVKCDTTGQLVWFKEYGGSQGEGGKQILAPSNNQYVVVGFSRSFGAGNSDVFLVSTDSTGTAFTNTLQGTVFLDENLSCVLDSGEIVAQQALLYLWDGTNAQWISTNSSGQFSIDLASGFYTVEVVPPSPYWEPCEESYTVIFTGQNDTSDLNIPLQAVYECPWLTVDVSTPFLRRCFPNTYQVQVQNLGVDTAFNSYVELLVDPFIRIDSASIPHVVLDSAANLFRFDLGDIMPMQERQFQVYTYLDCDSTVLGQTHCVEAHVYPDSLCLPISPSWDGSSIELGAVCDGDTARITIQNVGEGNMAQTVDFLVIEDQIIGYQGSVQLNSLEDTVLNVVPQGLTVRVESEQSPGHPGVSMPAVTVEGCGANPFSTGFVIQLPQNDANPFVEIDCQENIGSFDPNDKRAFPSGFGAENLIEAGTSLEYHIRFQNTGTDTAFRVVIRDTLSEWLDQATLQIGTASHPFSADLRANGVLVFTFDPIALPDSTTNEPASHGFVKFRIDLREDAPLGTLILNSAAIYFDFNAPIITNETMHLIGEDFLVWDDPMQTTHTRLLEDAPFEVYPNPFSGQTTIRLLGNAPEATMVLEVFDLQGNRLLWDTFTEQELTLEVSDWPSAMYAFRISTSRGTILGSGRLFVH